MLVMSVTVYFTRHTYNTFYNIVAIIPDELGIMLIDSDFHTEILYYCDIEKIVISKG